jgi:cephalosporin-C deacetylase
VVAHVPFLCAVRRAANTEGSLIRSLLDSAKMRDEEHLRVLEYFDPLQLAGALRVPVLLSSGGKDTTCPAETIRAVFDRLPGIKSLFHDPQLPHTTSEAFYRRTWEWLGDFLR